MIYYDDKHLTAYENLLSRYKTDVYYKALAYLLALDSSCREHLNDLFDFDHGLIKPEALAQSWQTSTSLKTTRLAFSLYTGGLVWCPDDELRRCSVPELFCCSLAPYYWEAIKIRFPEYTDYNK